MLGSLRFLTLTAMLALSTLAYAADPTPTSTASAPQADTPPAAAPAPASQAASAPAAATPAAAPAVAGKVGDPPPGKGQIVFFRGNKFMGAAIGFKVREGDKELGKLNTSRYFVVVADPGAHDYTVHSEAKDVLHMEVEAGETYYVIGSITMGFMVGRPNLSPSDKATFDKMSDILKPAQ